jgi:hypothetical protein
LSELIKSLKFQEVWYHLTKFFAKVLFFVILFYHIWLISSFFLTKAFLFILFLPCCQVFFAIFQCGAYESNQLMHSLFPNTVCFSGIYFVHMFFAIMVCLFLFKKNILYFISTYFIKGLNVMCDLCDTNSIVIFWLQINF